MDDVGDTQLAAVKRRVYVTALAIVAPLLPAVALIQRDREIGVVPVYGMMAVAVVATLVGLVTGRLSVPSAERVVLSVIPTTVLARLASALYLDELGPAATRALVTETVGPTLVAVVLIIFLALDNRPALRWTLCLWTAFTGLLAPAAVSLSAIDPGTGVALLRQVFTLLATVGLAAGLASLKGQLAAERARTTALGELANTDPLTGALNRRGASDVLTAHVERAERYHGTVSVALVDLDRFKERNDQLGHAAGDDALVRIVAEVGADLRAADALGRWGGDELLVVAPETSTSEVHVLADRWRAKIAELHLAAGPGVVTASIGVASYEPGDTIERLLMRADRALYAAKAAGGDRVVTRLDDDVAVVSLSSAG